MSDTLYNQRLQTVIERYQSRLNRKNKIDTSFEGFVVNRWVNPVLEAEDAPPLWRYDLNPKTNPRLLERQGINAAFNPGAIYHDGKFHLVARVEGFDRKSFFAVASSSSGVDGFRFHQKPVLLEQPEEQDTNVYDMRLTKHEDGYIYGLFCTERKDPDAAPSDTSSAVAACGIVRTKDLISWTRLPDLKSLSPQQRNVVLHPEFIDGKYGLYTRPQDGFIDTGSGGGIGWALCDSMEKAEIGEETIVDPRVYHTINEVKNGAGAPPIKTDEGWLHIAHGVRNTAAGLRYVLYVIMCDLQKPWIVTHRPGGYFMAPQNAERIGDVSNVLFCNGAVTTEKGEVFVYYASSDTRTHVATTDIDTLVDYAKNTPADPLASHLCVKNRIELIESNLTYLGSSELAAKVR